MASLFWILALWMKIQTEAGIEKDYGWLNGNWCGETGNKQAFCEKWTLKGEKLTGQGYFFSGESGKDTVFQEMLEILRVEGKEVYRVRLEKEGSPVDFIIESKGPEGFSCANRQNDFPKIIQYRVKGNRLVVDLLGNKEDSVVTFHLARQDEQRKN